MFRKSRGFRVDHARVKLYQIQRNLTGHELAEAVGLLDSNFSHALRGRRTLSRERLEKLARKLRVPTEAIALGGQS